MSGHPTPPAQLDESNPRHISAFVAGMQAARMALVKRGWTTDAPMSTAEAVAAIDRERANSVRVLADQADANADGVRKVLAARPVLPYRSHTTDGLSGVVVATADGLVLVDGLAHTPAAAIELSAAIARAARDTTPTTRVREEATHDRP